MKKVIALAVAFVAMAIVSAPEANAQSFNSGFQFGSGVNASGGFTRGGGLGFSSFFGGLRGNRVAAPPYFAQFPPVYYNGIVRRPYGISPFAAPAGVEPVELRYQNQPHREPSLVQNPFFNQPSSKPVSVLDEKEAKAESTENKSTMVNPFFSNDPTSVGPTVQASYESVER